MVYYDYIKIPDNNKSLLNDTSSSLYKYHGLSKYTVVDKGHNQTWLVIPDPIERINPLLGGSIAGAIKEVFKAELYDKTFLLILTLSIAWASHHTDDETHAHEKHNEVT